MRWRKGRKAEREKERDGNWEGGKEKDKIKRELIVIMNNSDKEFS